MLSSIFIEQKMNIFGLLLQFSFMRVDLDQSLLGMSALYITSIVIPSICWKLDCNELGICKVKSLRDELIHYSFFHVWFYLREIYWSSNNIRFVLYVCLAMAYVVDTIRLQSKFMVYFLQIHEVYVIVYRYIIYITIGPDHLNLY